MLVAHNNMSGKIEVMSGKIEDMSLPEEVDVILAEWMGTLLLVRFNWILEIYFAVVHNTKLLLIYSL